MDLLEQYRKQFGLYASYDLVNLNDMYYFRKASSEPEPHIISSFDCMNPDINACIHAPRGSGKTRYIARKTVHLLTHCHDHNIIVIVPTYSGAHGRMMEAIQHEILLSGEDIEFFYDDSFGNADLHNRAIVSSVNENMYGRIRCSNPNNTSILVDDASLISPSLFVSFLRRNLPGQDEFMVTAVSTSPGIDGLFSMIYRSNKLPYIVVESPTLMEPVFNRGNIFL